MTSGDQARIPTWTKSYTYLGDSQLSTITPNGSGGEYTEYNHPDRLGTRLITNQAGGTSYEQAHLPFGKALNAESTITNNNKRFTSYDRSAPTGLDYAVNRTYDSKQGRFTQVDPIGMSATSLGSPQSLNLYAYCGNDPINNVDPSGLFWGSLFKWIGRIIKVIIIAIAVAIAVAVIFFPPVGLTAWGIAAYLIMSGTMITGALAPPKIGAIIGRIAGQILSGPGIIVNFARTVKNISLWQKVLAASNFVGSIANLSGGDDDDVIKVETKCPKNLRIENEDCPSPWWAKGNIGSVNSWLNGFADGLLFDLPSKIDEWNGVNRGSDFDSSEFSAGWWTGTAASLIIPALGAGKAIKGASLGTKLFARGRVGVLNRRFIRIGWGFERSLKITPGVTGRQIFRIGIGNKPSTWHIRLWPR